MLKSIKVNDLSFRIGHANLTPLNSSKLKQSWPEAVYALDSLCAHDEEVGSTFKVEVSRRQKREAGSETSSFSSSPRTVMPRKFFETQYISSFSKIQDGDSDIITRSDKLLLLDLANASYLLSELDLFLFLCPSELTNFFRNWSSGEQKHSISGIDDYDLYQALRHQVSMSEKPIVGVTEVPLFTATYRLPRDLESLHGKPYEFISFRTSAIDEDFTPGRSRLIIEQLSNEVRILSEKLKSTEVLRAGEKLIKRIQESKDFDSAKLESFALNRDVDPLSTEDQYTLLKALTDRQSAKAKMPNHAVHSGKVVLTLPERIRIGNLTLNTSWTSILSQSKIKAASTLRAI